MRRIGVGPHVGIFGINENIFGVVNVPGKIGGGKVIEGFGEEKSAGGTPMIVDGNSQQGQNFALSNIAVLMKVDDAEKFRGLAAAFAHRMGCSKPLKPRRGIFHNSPRLYHER